MNNIEKTLQQYIDSTNSLLIEFWRIYFDWADPERIVRITDNYLWPHMFWDMYFSIEDIYTALQWEIPENILFEWYDYAYECHLEEKKVEYNLLNYFKINANKKM